MSKKKREDRSKFSILLSDLVRALKGSTWLGKPSKRKRAGVGFPGLGNISSAGSHITDDDENLNVIVTLVYNHYLRRDPDPAGLQTHKSAIRHGMPLSKFVKLVIESPERKQKSGSIAPSDDSDGSFLLHAGEILFQGTAARPKELEFYKKYLREEAGNRTALIQQMVCEHIVRLRSEGETVFDVHNCWIMGTNRFLTKELWDARVKELNLSAHRTTRPKRVPLSEREFHHTGTYKVSAIASLYKGREFLEAFLDNITSQTIFDQAELIIVDANSPEGEEELIRQYQAVYPNIVYKRINYRIGIYDAWNVGVEHSRGQYLTNTNLDDLRRVDSLELQAAALDTHEFADVVYQDFLYSLDSSFTFDEVAACGFKSELPLVTPNNMFEFNSPHNAPMWRKSVHADVGLFDIAYKSAGDYEFWLRCLAHKKMFFKINTPHVVYFQNPEGISTAPNSRGIEEARRVWKTYSRKLTSSYLAMSREDFAEELDIESDWKWEMCSYDVVQARLRALGDGAKAA